MEPLDRYLDHATRWVRDHLAPMTSAFIDEQKTGDGSSARKLQRLLFDAGYAGIAWPREYGGRGLPIEYQLAFNRAAHGFEMPIALNMTLGIIGPTLLEFGTDEQKARFVLDILRGDAIWVQLLSEPTGGSDLAGVLTHAARVDDGFRLTGTKTWTSRADRADWALCLARTDWTAPKHRGLTMFVVDMHDPGVEIRPIKQVDGGEGFCEEFLDVIVHADRVLGAENGGWTVARGLLAHERAALGGSSVYLSGDGYQTSGTDDSASLVATARSLGLARDPRARQLVARDHAATAINRMLADRVRKGMATGQLPAAAGAIVRLSAGTTHVLHARLAFELAGPLAVFRPDGDAGRIALDYLSRQGHCLGGGSSEMQRNIISERLLGMPRELAADRGRAFREVRHNS